jgi:solute:Na+ symporter, SSS family
MHQANWTVLSLTAVYMVGMGLISYYAKRLTRTATSFTTGGTAYPAVLVGFLLMSEFIGTTASIGTTQAAYKWGISAAWNIAVLGVGFLIYGLLLARKFKELGENTISGALASGYGPATKLATSVIMIFALQIVAVSLYASGGAVLAALLNVPRNPAIIITGVIGVLYVSMGGMRSVIYTNVLHAMMKYLGMVVALVFGLSQVGGFSELRGHLPPQMFAVDNVGWSQIFAWFIAGIGAVCSTQYVLQAISTVEDARRAQTSSFWTAVLLIPFGICAALVGMCAAVLYPKIDTLQAFPTLIANMDNLLATIVVAGLAASLFGTISAISIGTATLIYKDFYLPFLKQGTDDTGGGAPARPARAIRARCPESDVPRQIAARYPRCPGAAHLLCAAFRHQHGRGGQHPRLARTDNRLVSGRRPVRHRQRVCGAAHSARGDERNPPDASLFCQDDASHGYGIRLICVDAQVCRGCK